MKSCNVTLNYEEIGIWIINRAVFFIPKIVKMGHVNDGCLLL